MKGFGIEIKNNLLEPKHIEAMGISVWLYMWMIDKMTSISEDGIGLVLGGKPIKFEEVEVELGIGERTYSRWVSALSSGGYINVKRTPYGLIFSVNKAFKHFGRRSDRSGVSDKKEIGQKWQTSTTKVADLSDKSGGSNKTVSVDTPEDTAVIPAAAGSKEISEFIFLFKDVNPTISILYGRPPQRQAAERLLGMHPLGWWENFMRGYTMRVGMDKFCPRATTPVQLESKLGAIMVYGRQQKAGSKMAVI